MRRLEPAIEHNTFLHVERRVETPRIIDAHHALEAHFVKRFSHELAKLFVLTRNGSNARDVLTRLDGNGRRAQLFVDGIANDLHAPPQSEWVGAGCNGAESALKK